MENELLKLKNRTKSISAINYFRVEWVAEK